MSDTEETEAKTGKKNYQVRIGGGFILNIRAKSEAHAEGIAEGQIRAQLPRFIISSILVDELPEE